MLCLIIAFAAVLGHAPMARAQHAVRSLASLPETVDMAVSVVGASSLMRGDRPLLVALSEWGWAQETKPAFEVLADRLGEPAEVAFSRLLGRRATLVIREHEGESHWVVVSEVDAKTAARLPGQLEAKPLRISSTLPVQGLERRSFEFTISPINPNTNTAWAFLGPARASELFDTIVGSVMGAPGGPRTLSQGEHAELFKNARKGMGGAIAVFMQRPEPNRAVLATASRDDTGWDVTARARPATDWFPGLLPNAEETANLDVEKLPALAAPTPSDELLSVWSLPWHDEPRLDAVTGSVLGQVLWSCIKPLQSPRGFVLSRSAKRTQVMVAALSSQPQAALSHADAVLASQAGASNFGGQLPDAVRTSECKMPSVFAKTALRSVAWATPPPTASDREGSRWLVLVASDNSEPGLAGIVDQQAQRCETRAEPEAGIMLNHGRMRPRTLLAGFMQQPEHKLEQPSAVDLLRTIERMQWRMALVGDQLRSRLRLDLYEDDPAPR